VQPRSAAVSASTPTPIAARSARDPENQAIACEATGDHPVGPIVGRGGGGRPAGPSV
jgi:hypothetical protein